MIEDHPLHPAPWSSRARLELNRDTFSSTSALRWLLRTLVRRVSYTVDVIRLSGAASSKAASPRNERTDADHSMDRHKRAPYITIRMNYSK